MSGSGRLLKKFDPNKDYVREVSELIAACRRLKYFGVSPENLAMHGMPPVAIIGDGNSGYTALLDPRIETSESAEDVYEACANFFLMHNGAEIHPVVQVLRPRFISVSYRLPDASRTVLSFADTRPFGDGQPTTAAVVAHELDHHKGVTIVDKARASLAWRLRAVASIYEHIGTDGIPDHETAEMVKAEIQALMPFVLMYDGKTYRCHHGSEFEGQEPPAVSPDAVFTDGFFASVSEIEQTRVPRDGELIPIIPSKAVLSAAHV